MTPRFVGGLVCLFVGAAALTTGPASAQLFSFRSGAQAVQSLSFGYSSIDFAFDGREDTLSSFDFEQPAFGLVYTRPRLLVTFALGDQQADDNGLQSLRLLDLSLTTWGELQLPGLSAGPTRVFVPVLLFSNYRRVSPKGDTVDTLLDAFNVTVLGLGVGLGLDHTFGEAAFFAVRVNPVLGVATSSLTDAFGSAYLIDADAQVHLAELFGRIGLSVGYTFRRQVWNVNASNLFPEATDDLFDYKGLHHLFRVGLNW